MKNLLIILAAIMLIVTCAVLLTVLVALSVIEYNFLTCEVMTFILN